MLLTAIKRCTVAFCLFLIVKCFLVDSADNVPSAATSGSNRLTDDVIPSLEKKNVVFDCQPDDVICSKDRAGFEAISQLHAQIDDDHDGGLNRAESDEFFRDDLKHEGRSATFHGNDDFITVYDLWHMWIKSEVYNWTVDDVVNWLSEHVELSQYETVFRLHSVTGKVLPRLASNYQALVTALGIKNIVHKQKLTVKATDVVLFGPPKSRHNFVRDVVILAVSLAVASGGCYFAYLQHRRAQSHVQKLTKDLSSLQNAEDTLAQMQQQLEEARNAQRNVLDDKEKLEKKLRDEVSKAKCEAERLRQQRETKQEEFSKLKLAEEELAQVRLALYEAERQLEDRQHAPFANLQQWLQLTYEVETRYFEERRHAAEKQLLAAKDMCEKIRRQKGRFLGSFRVAHTASLDETDSKILSVRTALEEIKMELNERTQRWKQIETICGFNIMTNPGIPYLESLLRSGAAHLDGPIPHGRSQSNFMLSDSADDDVASTMFQRPLHGVSGYGHCDQLRDIKGTGLMGSQGSLLQAGLAPSHIKTPALSVRSRIPKNSSQYAETGSMDSLTSSDNGKNIVFDLGGESSGTRNDDCNGTSARSLNKSHSEPERIRREDGLSSAGSSNKDLSTASLNSEDSHESESTSVKAEERKKKSALPKFFGSKQKSV